MTNERTMTRPMWPPGSEIAAQCFDAYAAFESRWEEDLEGIDDIYERATIYGLVMDGVDIDLAKMMARHEMQRS